MEKHYIIRSKEGKYKEKVFDGTLEEALQLQDFNGTAEEDKTTLSDVENFLELLMMGYFGDGSDGYTYEEVTKEEYNECN